MLYTYIYTMPWYIVIHMYLTKSKWPIISNRSSNKYQVSWFVRDWYQVEDVIAKKKVLSLNYILSKYDTLFVEQCHSEPPSWLNNPSKSTIVAKLCDRHGSFLCIKKLKLVLFFLQKLDWHKGLSVTPQQLSERVSLMAYTVETYA